MRDSTFEDTYRTHSSAVHAVAVGICGQRLAPDVTQEVFVQLWQRPEVFDPARGSLRALLVAMARNRAIDIVRAETARRAREERDGRMTAEEPPAEVHARLLQRELAGIVTSALDHLPTDERDAIVTAFYGGISYREVATVLGMPEGTVKSRIRSGMARMRATLVESASAAPLPVS